MIVPSFCNLTECVGVLDYAYLATNVYHDHTDNTLLGKRPTRLLSSKKAHELFKKWE